MALSHMNFAGNSNDNQQRHIGYANSNVNSFRQAQRSVASESTSKKDKNHHVNRPKFNDFRGKSWSEFAEHYGCESSDDDSDDDTTDDDPLISSAVKKRNSKGSVVKLKLKDRSLYGTFPETDPFRIVHCRNCKMVLKISSLKSHLERHDKEKKHEQSSDSSPIKHERVEKFLNSTTDKTSSVTEKLDKISVGSEKYEKIQHSILDEKLTEEKRQRTSILKKPTAAAATISDKPSLNTLKFDTLNSPVHDSSSNNTISRRRKRKHEEIEKNPPTFQNATTITSLQPTSSPSCRTITILEQPEFLPLQQTSSPPPLAPITSKSNDHSTSVVLQITKFMPTTATVIDGSFLVQPLEQEEAEIDLKDLKILKPIMKESSTSSDIQTHLTSSNFFAGQPKPLAMNTFNLKKINAQSYVMSTQRKLVEFSRNLNLKSEEKIVSGKATPKTWSFIERSQVFTLPNPIFTRITH